MGSPSSQEVKPMCNTHITFTWRWSLLFSQIFRDLLIEWHLDSTSDVFQGPWAVLLIYLYLESYNHIYLLYRYYESLAVCYNLRAVTVERSYKTFRACGACIRSVANLTKISSQTNRQPGWCVWTFAGVPQGVLTWVLQVCRCEALSLTSNQKFVATF